MDRFEVGVALGGRLSLLLHKLLKAGLVLRNLPLGVSDLLRSIAVSPAYFVLIVLNVNLFGLGSVKLALQDGNFIIDAVHLLLLLKGQLVGAKDLVEFAIQALLLLLLLAYLQLQLSDMVFGLF